MTNSRRDLVDELLHPDRIPVPPNTVALLRFYSPEYHDALASALGQAFGTRLTVRADVPGTAGWIVIVQDPEPPEGD